mmetsp:Transcript_49515/g.78382  ORF Transcript_49515/g.78382 Transcript_49515/m.78382 type:complete len:393 (+) Transcript_49515:157-1335(+)
MADPEQIFSGTVKSFNATKGWGFVESAESQQLYGSDVFLLKSALKGAIGCAAGDKVNFQVSQGPKGLQAKNVEVTSGSGDENQNFFGTIKGFDPAKGWGFITCDLATQTFGKDVFVTSKQVPGGLIPGTQVQFTVRIEDKGPVAQSIKVLNQGKGGAGVPMMMGKGMMGKGYGGMPQWAMQQFMGPPMWGKGAPPWGGQNYGMQNPAMMWGGMPMFTSIPKDPDPSQVFFGTMKTINAEKGWGHIECEALKKLYGKDVFVMKSNLENIELAVGQDVHFNVAQGPKGPHAVNLSPFVGQPVSGQTYSGTIKSFNETKGWGFVDSETARQVYKQDVFLHMKELSGGIPRVGDQVQFAVDIAGGRPAAKSVVLIQPPSNVDPSVPNPFPMVSESM